MYPAQYNATPVQPPINRFTPTNNTVSSTSSTLSFATATFIRFDKTISPVMQQNIWFTTTLIIASVRLCNAKTDTDVVSAATATLARLMYSIFFSILQTFRYVFTSSVFFAA